MFSYCSQEILVPALIFYLHLATCFQYDVQCKKQWNECSHPLVPGGWVVGSRTRFGYQNLWMLKPHSQPYISVFLHPWSQPTADSIVMYAFIGKKSMCKWIQTVQTHVVQRSTVICSTLFITLKIKCIPISYSKWLCFLKGTYTKIKNDLFCHKWRLSIELSTWLYKKRYYFQFY